LRIRLCTVSESEATKRIGSACPLKLHANTTSGTRKSLVLREYISMKMIRTVCCMLIIRVCI
jgi:hypothetical protein